MGTKHRNINDDVTWKNGDKDGDGDGDKDEDGDAGVGDGGVTDLDAAAVFLSGPNVQGDAPMQFLIERDSYAYRADPDLERAPLIVARVHLVDACDGALTAPGHDHLDVDALAASAGLSLTANFVVKFQQYDNYAIATDGFAFDDISVN